jgi:hypothetical protein
MFLKFLQNNTVKQTLFAHGKSRVLTVTMHMFVIPSVCFILFYVTILILFLLILWLKPGII